jgi:hypothetical protein
VMNRAIKARSQQRQDLLRIMLHVCSARTVLASSMISTVADPHFAPLVTEAQMRVFNASSHSSCRSASFSADEVAKRWRVRAAQGMQGVSPFRRCARLTRRGAPWILSFVVFP